MRGTKAKRLRRLVYGAEGSSRTRELRSSEPPKRFAQQVFNHLNKVIGHRFITIWHGTIVADDKRRLYQSLKRA